MSAMDSGDLELASATAVAALSPSLDIQDNGDSMLLQYDGHGSQLLSTAFDYSQIGLYADVELLAGVSAVDAADDTSPVDVHRRHHRVPVHSQVLASCSSLLSTILQEVLQSSSAQSAVVPQLILPDFDLASLRGFLSFVYNGVVYTPTSDQCNVVKQLLRLMDIRESDISQSMEATTELTNHQSSVGKVVYRRQSRTVLNNKVHLRSTSLQPVPLSKPHLNHSPTTPPAVKDEPDAIASNEEEKENEGNSALDFVHVDYGDHTGDGPDMGDDDPPSPAQKFAPASSNPLPDAITNGRGLVQRRKLRRVLMRRRIGGRVSRQDGRVSLQGARVSRQLKDQNSLTAEQQNGGPHSCHICAKEFPKYSRLIKHIRLHTGEKPFRCQYCELSFSNPNELASHTRRVHSPDDKQFQCTFCGKSFAEKQEMQKHARTHTGEKPYECDICQRKFTDNSALNKHKSTCGVVEQKCMICGEGFKKKSQLIKHINSHTAEGSKPLVVSAKRRLLKGAAARRMSDELSGGERSHACGTCYKRFPKLSVLKKHERVHTGEKPFSCVPCKKYFSERSNLIGHRLRFHRTTEKQFQCDQCGKRFVVNYDLVKHKRIHTGEKPYVCTVCGKRFTDNSGMHKHSVIHTGDRQFCCNICGDRFTQNVSLKGHMLRLHSDQKPFGCNICQKRFGLQSTLDHHVKNFHTGELKFHCLQCGKGFSQNWHLRRHEKIHSGLKPYECQICQKKFTEMDYLRRHSAVHQKNKLSADGKNITAASDEKLFAGVQSTTADVKPKLNANEHCSEEGDGDGEEPGI